MVFGKSWEGPGSASRAHGNVQRGPEDTGSSSKDGKTIDIEILVSGDKAGLSRKAFQPTTNIKIRVQTAGGCQGGGSGGRAFREYKSGPMFEWY